MIEKVTLYSIYREKNLINNKTYIGQHNENYHARNIDGEYRGSGKILTLAQQKYGLQNFEHEKILLGYFTKKQIDGLEIFFIKLEKELGHGEYNIAKGGNGGNILYYMTETQKKEFSQKIKNSGQVSYWKGKHHSCESKEKIKLAILGKKHPYVPHKGMSDYNKLKKGCKVQEVFSKKNFNSLHEAEDFFKISRYKIKKSCENQTIIDKYLFKFK